MITLQDVEHVAKLARLELTEEEKIKFTTQLGDVLKYVDQMNEVDTTGVEPMSHVFPVNNVMREDVVTNGDGREATLANAPENNESGFIVPKTVES